MKKTILITALISSGFALLILASPPTTTDDTANYSPKLTAANATFSGLLTTARLSGNQGTVPTVVTNNGLNAGATLALDANASDTRFLLTITTGGTTTASATNVTVTFGTAKANAPYVFLTCANVTSTANGTTRTYITNATTAGFNICSGGTALTTASTYMFYVWIVE